MERPAKLDSTHWSPRLRSLPGDPECLNGGLMILGGRDLNRDGILDPEETTMSQLICNGSDALPTLSQVLPLSLTPKYVRLEALSFSLGWISTRMESSTLKRSRQVQRSAPRRRRRQV